jgi:integrase
MATGIRKRHSARCRSQGGERCNCRAGWEASVFDRRSGQKVRKTFDREADAKVWRADKLAGMRRGKSVVPTRITLREVADEFLAAAEKGRVTSRKGQRYKPATLRSYRHALEQRMLPELGALQVSEIRRRDVQGLADRMLGEGLSPSTVHNMLDPLRSIFRRAIQRELVEENPTAGLDLPTPSGDRQRIATPTKAAALIAALPHEDRALWASAFYAGLRRGELMALRCSDVDLGRSEIRVERGWDQYEGEQDPKSKAGTRTVPILAVLRDYLDDHLLSTGRQGNDLVFGRDARRPFVASTVDNRARRAWEEAKLTGLTMHECRHTFASLLIDSGANPKAVQEFMGHGSIKVTFDTYGHLFPGSRDEVRERMDSYLARCASGAPVSSPKQPAAAVTEEGSEARNPAC